LNLCCNCSSPVNVADERCFLQKASFGDAALVTIQVEEVQVSNKITEKCELILFVIRPQYSEPIRSQFAKLAIQFKSRSSRKSSPDF